MTNMRTVALRMQTSHVVCRDLTHSWEPFTAEQISGGYRRTLRCVRCGTRRTDALNRRGKVTKRKYVYPENYLVSGIGRLTGDTKNAMRLEALKRFLADDPITLKD